MKKNVIKAIVLVVSGSITFLATIIGIFAMYISKTFLPIYVGSTYVVGNQIVRYALYIILATISILSAILAACGVKYLNKKFRKIRRR